MILLRQRLYSKEGQRKLEERAKKRANKNKWLVDLAEKNPKVSVWSREHQDYAGTIDLMKARRRCNLTIKALEEEAEGNTATADKIRKKINNIVLYDRSDPRYIKAGKVAKGRAVIKELAKDSAESEQITRDVYKNLFRNIRETRGPEAAKETISTLVKKHLKK